MTDSSTSSTPTANATGIALGASIALVVLLIAGGIVTVVLRRRRRVFTQLRESELVGRPSVAVDQSHPASRVTPFTPGREEDGPRFSTSRQIFCTSALILTRLTSTT